MGCRDQGNGPRLVDIGPECPRRRAGHRCRTLDGAPWQISQDEHAVQARKEQAAHLVQRSWEIAAEMQEKARTAPVRSVQEAAIAYGIFVDKALLIEARTASLMPDNGKKTLADFMTLFEQENTRRKQEYLANHPAITATVVRG